MSITTPRRLGGLDHIPIGLGCMGMSDFYGPADEATSIATIHAALEAGVTYFDTGDFYGSGHNEMLLGRALAGQRDRAFVAVKFGALRDPAGGFTGYDLRPVAIRNFLTMTLKRLPGLMMIVGCISSALSASFAPMFAMVTPVVSTRTSFALFLSLLLLLLPYGPLSSSSLSESTSTAAVKKDVNSAATSS